jgi:xylulose-5-phosphate/fructose-6-phosphate phosphoketolase
VQAEATRVQGTFLRDVMKLNLESRNFRIFSPDENNSNRWQDVLSVTNRCFVAEIRPEDDHLAPDGRVMEVLSEHQCQGWLEGYLLTGRHGFFSCYEAFIHIVDSMVNQHAKWLKVCGHIPWRRPIASSTTCSARTSGGRTTTASSHQDPGFIDHVVNKKAEIVRVYLLPRQLPALGDRSRLRSRNYINVIVAGKQPAPSGWMAEAVKHCTRHRHLENGPPTTRAENRTRSWPAAGTCPPWKPWPRWRSCAALSRAQGPGGQRGRPS